MTAHPQNEGLRPIPEDQRASATLIVWTDIAPEDDAAFNEWYNREHMQDRVCELPGFVRARRYVAVEGAPKYLALYDLADTSVFSSEAYVAMISQPDARSQYFITRFQNAYRTLSRIEFSYGEGEGGALALWPLDVQAPGADSGMLRSAAREALTLPGGVAAHVLSKDEEALATSSRRHVRQGNRAIERAVMFEAMDLPSLRGAAEFLSRRLGDVVPRPALFQLLYRVSR